MPIDIDISKVARLARIELTEEEIAAYGEQLEAILTAAEELQALPTEGIVPTAHALPSINAFRPDAVTPSLAREDILAEAPEVEGPYFVVPRILDDAEASS